MLYKFNGNYEVVSSTLGDYSLDELELEQGMYSATPDFCRRHGGPVTTWLLGLVPNSYFAEADKRGLYANIDVRVHRLYPGNYPAYPGWHCDTQFRETFFGQPQLEQTELSDHLIATVSSSLGGVSQTQFLDQDLDIDVDGGGGPDVVGQESFWKKVDSKVRELDYDFKMWTMPDGKLTRFDCWTLHRCVPASVRGWRLFFRVAMWYRPNIDGGKLSRQEMIYMDVNQATGW